jgi:multidrug efflux pump subunit AcrA (membrane-fusion protein)
VTKLARLALSALVLAGCHRAPAHKSTAASAVQIAKVTRGSLGDRVLLTGELRAAHAEELVVPRTTVTWELAIRWMAEDGTMVKAGDRVLAFDNSAVTSDLEAKKLALLEAQMTLQSARDVSAMETENKDNELAQHQVALDKAKIKASVPGDLLAKREAQERQLDQKRAEIAVKKAKEDLDAQKQEADLDNKVKAIDLEKAKRAIDDSTSVIDALEIKAPRDGIVVIGTHPWEDRKYRLGDTVQPGWSIITMPDASAGMEVHAELSDVDDGRVSIGMTGSCTLDAYPAEPIACTVTQLTPVARSKGEQSLRRAFSVELSLAKPDARLRPGMSVKVELSRPGIANAVLVPRGAVVFPSDGKQVRVRVPGGGLHDVTLGPCDEQRCAVEQGLAEGDQVVIGGGA